MNTHIVGKDSLRLGKVFPYFVGKYSRILKENFPTIYGTIETNEHLQAKSHYFIYIVASFPDKNKAGWKKKGRTNGFWLWEIPWKSMRNSGFLKEIDEESMRNTCFKNVSHNVILWLRVLYLESMRMWEIKLVLRQIWW